MSKLLWSPGKEALPVLPQINCLISSRRSSAVKSILIAGGEIALREHLGWVLGAAGYQVHELCNDACLADIVESKSVDLIMTDIGTLDQEELEAISDVKRKRPEIKIIAISENYTYQWCYKELEPSRLLKKPFDSADLRAIVGSLPESS